MGRTMGWNISSSHLSYSSALLVGHYIRGDVRLHLWTPCIGLVAELRDTPMAQIDDLLVEVPRLHHVSESADNYSQLFVGYMQIDPLIKLPPECYVWKNVNTANGGMKNWKKGGGEEPTQRRIEPGAE